jgi:hypothetical protein
MIRVRPALLSDLEAIREVSVRNGLSSFDPESRRAWWRSHPFRGEFENVPMGWVLETGDSEIVGTFSNIHLMCELDGRPVKAAVAGSWGVDTQHRKSSLLMLLEFLEQTGVDLCLDGSASEAASRIMTGLRVPRIPSPDYDLSYLWIARRRAFAAAALRKRVNPAVARVAAPAVAAGLWLAGLRPTGARPDPANVRRLHEFGGEFDGLWEKLRREPGRLRAVRTAAALDWRYGASLRQKRLVVLGHFHGGELRGYVLLRSYTREHLNLRQFVIADLQALEDAPGTLLALLAAARETTRQEGLDMLEWKGWNRAKRQAAVSLRPHSYRDPVWPLYYKAVNPGLAPSLEQPGPWDFSPFDAF